MTPNIQKLFPGLAGNGRLTSPQTPRYNCIAWAVGDTARWWWPVGAYWPSGASAVESASAFAEAFATEGFLPCDDPSLESGYEKIALYSKNGVPTHAARQVASGRWTSKLGKLEDVEHNTLGAVEGGVYGIATFYFRRPRPKDG